MSSAHSVLEAGARQSESTVPFEAQYGFVLSLELHSLLVEHPQAFVLDKVKQIGVVALLEHWLVSVHSTHPLPET